MLKFNKKKNILLTFVIIIFQILKIFCLKFHFLMFYYKTLLNLFQGNINKIIHLEQLKELISEITDLNRILTISVKYIKEISEEENEMALRDNQNCAIDEGFITENDVVDENNDENLIKLKFKEYLKERLQKFQNETDTDKLKQKDLSIKLKKFLQNSLYV